MSTILEQLIDGKCVRRRMFHKVWNTICSSKHFKNSSFLRFGPLHLLPILHKLCTNSLDFEAGVFGADMKRSAIDYWAERAGLMGYIFLTTLPLLKTFEFVIKISDYNLEQWLFDYLVLWHSLYRVMATIFIIELVTIIGSVFLGSCLDVVVIQFHDTCLSSCIDGILYLFTFFVSPQLLLIY